MDNIDNLKLIYVKFLGKNTDETYVYNFFFSETPEYVWGPSWDIDNPINNGDITPDSTTYSVIKSVITTLPLKTAEETNCYSMEYATYGILALSWIDIENLNVYPQNGRLTMYFGETYQEIENKLALYNWNFK